MSKENLQLIFRVVCPKCLRIYVQVVPILSSVNTMRFKCEICDIVLVRFEMSDGKKYEGKGDGEI